MRKEVTIWRVMSKKLLIAGGGIGGMAAALAAARAGWQVQVLERASAFSEVGAGVQIGPNVTRVLHAWGLQEALRAVAAFPDALLVRDTASGAELGYMQLGERAQRLYGAPYATIHRADLHQALAAAAQAESQVQVHAGKALACHEDQGAAVQAFSASQTWQADALIGADGLWSEVRPVFQATWPGAPCCGRQICPPPCAASASRSGWGRACTPCSTPCGAASG